MNIIKYLHINYIKIQKNLFNFNLIFLRASSDFILKLN